MIISEKPRIELLNVDCMEYMASVPDKYFDLAIVDPPYGIGEHGQRMNRTERWRNPGPIKYKRVKWDSSAPNEKYFYELNRVSKNQIIWGANHFLDNLPFRISSPCWLVWDKKTAGDFADCELAWTSFDKSVRKFEWLWSGFRKQEPEERIHPTQKPVKLYRWLLENYAKKNRCGGKHTDEYIPHCTVCREPFRILDTHGGSMSSAIACHQMGFDLTLCELDKDYYEAGVKRFKEQTMQQSLFK